MALQIMVNRVRPLPLQSNSIFRFAQESQRRCLHSDGDLPSHLVAAPSQKKNAASTSPFARLARRIQLAMDHIRLKSLLPNEREDAAAASINVISSETDIENVAEQRIWHSVLMGDFEKLSGQGKPLKSEGNPHADPAEDLLYRVLSKNGFAPEWVELNREIRFLMERWRRALRYSWERKVDMMARDVSRGEALWREDLRFLEKELKEINKKVFDYNLIVPFGRQVFKYRLEEELNRVQNVLE